MKIVQLLFLLIFPLTLLAQKTTSPYTKLLAKNDSIGIQIIRTGNSVKTDYYVVYNQTDSILFHSLNREFYNDPSVYERISIDKPIQLDNIGKKEIRLYHVLNGAPTKEEDNKTLYIINLDTKQKIFEGKYYYSNVKPPRNEIVYKITFDSTGNLVIEHDKYTCSITPDRKEGIYSLVDGKYKWMKSQYVYTRKTLARDDSSGVHVTAISRCENFQIEYFLFYNNDADSIKFLRHFTCYEHSVHDLHESCKMKLMQLDKKGRPEVIVEYSSYSGSRSSAETIVFNIDSGEIIFFGPSNFFSMYEGEQMAKCKGYTTTIKILDSGDITVTHSANSCMDSGLKAGVYKIINGKYEWMEK